MKKFLNTERGVLIDIGSLRMVRKLSDKVIRFDLSKGLLHDEIFANTVERDAYFESFVAIVNRKVIGKHEN